MPAARPRPARRAARVAAGALAVLTGVLVSAAPASAAAPAAADPGVALDAPLHVYVGEADGNLHVVGEVLASRTVDQVTATVELLDSTGQHVLATSTAVSRVGAVRAGTHAPFDALVRPVPADHGAARLVSLTATPATNEPSDRFDVQPGTPGPSEVAAGTVTNRNGYAVSSVHVVATCRAADGIPLWTGFVDALDSGYRAGLAPGASAAYRLTRDRSGPPASCPGGVPVVAFADDPGPALPQGPAAVAAVPGAAAVVHGDGRVGLVGQTVPRDDPAPAGVRPTALPPTPAVRHDRPAGFGDAPVQPGSGDDLVTVASRSGTGPRSTDPLGVVAVLALVVVVGVALRRGLGARSRG